MAMGPTDLQGLNTYLSLQQAGGGGGGGGLDLSSAFTIGADAAAGPGADPSAMGADDEGGLGSISPLLMALTQQEMGGGDDTPTGEDRGLALAQAGFSMSAGDSPHALQNIGTGAVAGINSLQRLKQQRALQRMREQQLQQQTALRQASLIDAARQKQASLVQAKAIADERAEAQRRQDLQTAKHDTEMADIARARAAEKETADLDRADRERDRATALAEQRYTVNDRMRREQHQKTGQWAKIEGDEERGITGPPSEDTYNGPLITDPTVPLKERNKLKVAKPAQKQAVDTITMTLDKTIRDAQALQTHPGLSGHIGMKIPGQDHIWGTDSTGFRVALKSLKDKQFRDAIQSMRDASRTGGAVGNVSDREGERFENMVASLDSAQDEESFGKALKDIIEYSKYLRSGYIDKYKETYGDYAPKHTSAGSGLNPLNPLAVQEQLSGTPGAARKIVRDKDGKLVFE